MLAEWRVILPITWWVVVCAVHARIERGTEVGPHESCMYINKICVTSQKPLSLGRNCQGRMEGVQTGPLAILSCEQLALGHLGTVVEVLTPAVPRQVCAAVILEGACGACVL